MLQLNRAHGLLTVQVASPGPHLTLVEARTRVPMETHTSYVG